MLQKAWKEQLSCNLGKLAICPGLEDQERPAVGRTIIICASLDVLLFNRKFFSFWIYATHQF